MNLAKYGAPSFDIRELVPPELYNKRGNASVWHINPVLLKLLQFTKEFLSDYYGEEVSIIINDWLWGGDFTESGFRLPDTNLGSELSFHKGGLCSAADVKCRLKESNRWIPADDIRSIIFDHEKEFMAAGLTTLEAKEYAPTWVHMDCRLTGLDHILIVRPRTVGETET